MAVPSSLVMSFKYLPTMVQRGQPAPQQQLLFDLLEYRVWLAERRMHSVFLQ
jgi:hypothetical protein